MLLTPMIPYSPDGSVNNLRALAVVSSAADTYGRMVLYTFPKGSQILGPAQVNAVIDQNPEIAQKITLWNQEGSEVKRGKMIVLPVNGHILYIQPLYMEARGTPRHAFRTGPARQALKVPPDHWKVRGGRRIARFQCSAGPQIPPFHAGSPWKDAGVLDGLDAFFDLNP
jgi:hypothetical protein